MTLPVTSRAVRRLLRTAPLNKEQERDNLYSARMFAANRVSSVAIASAVWFASTSWRRNQGFRTLQDAQASEAEYYAESVAGPENRDYADQRRRFKLPRLPRKSDQFGEGADAVYAP